MKRFLGSRAWVAATVASWVAGAAASAAPINYQMVTVGNSGNAADTTGYGAVGYEYRIGKYEFTNQQYADFLNSVAATDTYSLYNPSMGSDAHGGITRSGVPGSYTYSVKANMGNKPVIYVSWFDAARVANWLQNGQGSNSTETGAYSLNGATTGAAPTKNPTAQVYIPSPNEWYKAAYCKGGGVNSGYWTYATQSNSTPTAVSADETGNGVAGSIGNSANYNAQADWNDQDGNVTTVGTNGGPSAYGAFDMGGNVAEWIDLPSTPGFSAIVGGNYPNQPELLSSNAGIYPWLPTDEYAGTGFRLASTSSTPVPEIDPAGTGSVLALVTGALGLLERRRKRA